MQSEVSWAHNCEIWISSKKLNYCFFFLIVKYCWNEKFNGKSSSSRKFGSNQLDFPFSFVSSWISSFSGLPEGFQAIKTHVKKLLSLIAYIGGWINSLFCLLIFQITGTFLAPIQGMNTRTKLMPIHDRLSWKIFFLWASQELRSLLRISYKTEVWDFWLCCTQGKLTLPRSFCDFLEWGGDTFPFAKHLGRPFLNTIKVIKCWHS